MAITKIGTPELFDFSATNTALQLPTGDTASRPAAPSTGEWRFNSQLKYVEYYDGGAWRQIDTESSAVFTPSENFNTNTYFGTGATQAIDAKFNEAANFNGSSSLIVTSSNFTGSTAAGSSISFWFKTSNTKYQNIFGNSTGFTSGSSISLGNAFGGITGESITFINEKSGSTEAFMTTDGAGAYADGVWRHAVFVSTSTTKAIYINGVSKTLTFFGGSASSDADLENIEFGLTKGSPSSSTFEGSLDQVRIYNDALTSSEVTDLYTNETTTTAATLDFPAGAGCIAAYQLDGDASDISGTYGGVTTDIEYTGLQFQPDFVWIKQRTAPNRDHLLFDSVRGPSTNPNFLYSNLGDAKATGAAEYLSSFNNNGFTVGNSNYTGASGEDYVAWCWKAGGASTLNQEGNVDTQVSVNEAAGFSIAVSTSVTNVVKTFGHGLSVPPELILLKTIDSSQNWLVYTAITGTGRFLNLNNSNILSAAGNYPDIFKSVSDKTIETKFDAADTKLVFYCFASILNYQKIGSYLGSGNANGEVVNTGFKPSFLMVKGTDVAATWAIFDNKRNTSNPRDTILQPNITDADFTSSTFNVNFYTNGFQFTGSNNDVNMSGKTYIYLAIAADKDTSVPTLANSFSPTIYTGTGAAQSIYTPFEPDLTWIKNRTNGYSHQLYDSVRGTGSSRNLQSDNAKIEGSDASLYGFLSSFDTNGYTVQSGTSSGYNNIWTNQSGQDYVAWNWKAGGLPTINNVAGSTITSIVSANQAAGFSIVKYTGNATAGATIGHGLSYPPEMIMVKGLNNALNWIVYNTGIGRLKYIQLNNTDAEELQSNYNMFDETAPSSTVFTLGNLANTNSNTLNYIAYCFHSVAGYQKIGIYSGNDGSNPISTSIGGDAGFQPRFVMQKRSNSPGGSWNIIDNQRGDDNYLSANLANAEGSMTAGSFTLTSTGFTLNNSFSEWNASGGEYIYLAIA